MSAYGNCFFPSRPRPSSSSSCSIPCFFEDDGRGRARACSGHFRAGSVRTDLPASRGWAAFTLLELLVVIAILGILAAVLLPVVGRVKDRAIRTTDINNLKQLLLAMHLYTGDQGDVLPWSNWGTPAGRPGWLYTSRASDTGTNRFRVQTGVFWPTLQNPKLYWCPQDKPSHPMFKYRDQQSSSYVMNGAVNGYHRDLYPPLHLGAFPTDAVIFWEADEQDPGFFNDGASRPEEGVTMRHEAGALSATFGGAVQYAKFDAWYREVISTNKSRLWCFPDSADGR